MTSSPTYNKEMPDRMRKRHTAVTFKQGYAQNKDGATQYQLHHTFWFTLRKKTILTHYDNSSQFDESCTQFWYPDSETHVGGS